MVILTSRSPEETFELASDFGKNAQPGLVIGLIGDLGAGKTQFVKGFASGLGISERVHSPTFTLVNEYHTGRVRCFHLDLYRLNSPEEVRSAGLEAYFEPKDGVTLIEWFDRVADFMPTSDRLLIIRLSAGESEDERTITYEDPRT